MNIKQKIERSKEQSPLNLMDIASRNSDEPFVAVEPTTRLLVIPTWIQPTDEFEGHLYNKYIQQHPHYRHLLTRKSVAEGLQKASKLLGTDYQLIVRAGHRPLSVQMELLRTLIDNYLEKHPGATEDSALDYARTYVADPEIEIPPHVCGAAVDVDVLNIKSKQLVDFGCAVNTDSPVAFLHSNKITKDQKANRLMLLEAMLTADFAPFSSEWWHYSYGDQMWAWFYGHKQSIYAIKEPQL